MSSSAIERKLAAIMFTDIARYTKQMSNDESVAINLLNKKESILKPLIKESDKIEFEVNLRLYELLEELSAIEETLAEKFLRYPTPKQIVEEWKKIQ